MATEFGKRLATARERAGFTQSELAAKVPMAQSTLASAEASGDGSRLTAQLAHHCGVSAYWLATGAGDMLAGVLPYQTPSPALRDLPQALPAVLAALAALPPLRWAAVRGQLDKLAGHPEMLDDALPELLHQLQGPLSKQQGSAA